MWLVLLPLVGRAAPPDPAPVACGPDIAVRRPDAVPDEPFDLDADGDLDLVYRAGHSLHGNADFLYYRVQDGCATWLGSVSAFLANPPRCAEAPVPGAICRLSALERMFHDDYQERIYAHRPGGFEVVARGRYVPPSRHPGE